MKQNNQIESHSSFITNQRIGMILAEIDARALASANSMHYMHITSYYNAVEQLYLNVTDLLNNTEKIELTRKNYAAVIEIIEHNPNCRTRKALNLMLQIVKKFNYLVVSGMQEKEYFFRMRTNQKKGLKDINFFENSIFATRGGYNGLEESQLEDAGE